MTIRPALSSDTPAILALMTLIAAEHAEREPAYFRPGQPGDAEQLRAFMASAQALVLVAEWDGRVVGEAQVTAEAIPDRGFLIGVRYAKVHELCVADDARRSGVGEALMAAIEAWAQEQGLAEVRLSVWSSNQGARGFYESAGYPEAYAYRIKRL